MTKLFGATHDLVDAGRGRDDRERRTIRQREPGLFPKAVGLAAINDAPLSVACLFREHRSQRTHRTLELHLSAKETALVFRDVRTKLALSRGLVTTDKALGLTALAAHRRAAVLALFLEANEVLVLGFVERRKDFDVLGFDQVITRHVRTATTVRCATRGLRRVTVALRTLGERADVIAVSRLKHHTTGL